MKPFKGFTLIEILVVIAVIAVLSAVVIASLNKARENGRLGAGKSFEANVHHAAGDEAVGMWDFDECSGTSAFDGSGNGSTGTLVGSPAWGSDVISSSGCSLTFTGTQYVTAPYSAASNIQNDITIMMWIKRSSITGYQPMLSKTNNSSWDYDFYFSTGFATVLNFYSSNTSPQNVLSTVPIADTTYWHHIAVVRKNSTVTFYVDGQAAGTATMTGAFGNHAYGTLIGTDTTGGNKFIGSIDRVRVYGKALTAAEIGARYATELPQHELATN